ncbi:MAG: CPBP family intramembrane glutamic endopeptidase [Candidatus Hydrogenedentota bacterium]
MTTISGRMRRPATLAALALLYVAAVLAIDTLASQGITWPLDWGHWFAWRTDNGFDLFKCVAWLAIPLVISLPWLDPAYFTFKRWRKVDKLLLGALALLGLGAILLILWVPALREAYPGLAQASPEARWGYSEYFLFWTVSWLPGWEFLHRYFLLRRVDAAWPRFGWLLIPLIECAYHLQKPLLEAGGMLALGLVLTWWTRRRRNILLAFIVHALIEIQLLLFLLFT